MIWTIFLTRAAVAGVTESTSSNSALFGAPGGTGALASGWFLLGSYVLAGLVCGAVCAYVAVGRGLSPAPWFFAGLAFNLIALAMLIAGSRRVAGVPPGVLPSGLRKVPLTLSPVACPSCGAAQHPASSACSACGGTLSPTAASDMSRA
jgi:hypothetical protein